MPITKGAHKAIRASKRKHVFNVRRKATMNDSVKKLRKFAEAGNKEEAEKMLSSAYQAIDKAAKRGVIKKNTAARKKSRISASIAKLK